jgi:TP901 family phage tail tape measure protein
MQLNGLQTAGAGMQSVGRSLTRSLTVPIVGLGLAAADLAVKFQASMERLHTQAGVAQSAIGPLSRAVLNMAGPVATAPQALAQAMYHVASSLNATITPSRRSAVEMQVLRIAAEGAKVGGADLVDVTNALDAAVVSGIKGVSDYSQAMGALNSVVGAGDMSMQNLADALSTGLLAPMKTYGLSLKDVGGALATFGDNNLRGQEAATKLISAVRIMAAPSKAAAKNLALINLSTLKLADDMRKGGLVGALTDLRKHLVDSGMTASEQGLVIARAFGGRQSTGVQVLLEQLDRLRAKTIQVGEGARGFGRAWNATTQTASVKIHAGLATMQADLTRFGNQVLPTLLGIGHTIVTDVDKVAHAFTSLPKGAQNAIIKGGLLLAAIGPAMKLLGLWTSGIGKLWQISTRLQGWGAASAAANRTPLAATTAGRALQSVATMNVGTLIARSSVGGGGVPGPGYAPGSTSSSTRPYGSAPVIPASVPAGVPAAEKAAVQTSMATSVASGVKSGLGRVLGRGLQGAMIAGIGTMISQAVGASIHGSVGKAVASIGTDTAIGAGIGRIFGPPGMIPGALLGAMVGAVTSFINHDAQAQGQAWADKFTASLPGTISARTKAALAAAAAKQPPPSVDTAAAARFQTAAQHGEADASRFNYGWSLGKIAGDQFVKSMGVVTHQSMPALLGSIGSALNTVPKYVRQAGPAAVKAWRDEAATQMLTYATSLERNGKLPRGAVDNLIFAMQQRFNGLHTFLVSSGQRNERAIAKGMDASGAVKALVGTLGEFRNHYNEQFQIVRNTNARVVGNTALAMGDLKWLIAHGAKDQRVAYMREADLLAAQLDAVWDRIGVAANKAMTAAATAAANIANALGGHVKLPGPVKTPRGHDTLPYKVPPTTHHQAAGAAGPPSQTAAQKLAIEELLGTAPKKKAKTRKRAAAKKIVTPPTFTPPSQTVSAQIETALLANQLQLAQNAGNIAGQQRALKAEVKLERSLLRADQKRLEHVNNTLRTSHLSSAKRGRLLQDRLTMLQEIGAVEGNIGSAMSSLANLTGSVAGAGTFDLAPAGGLAKLPTLYDVRRAIGRVQRSPRPVHKRDLHGAPVGAPQVVSVTPNFQINATNATDAHAVRHIVDKAVLEMEEKIDREVTTHLHAEARRAGYRGT